AVRDKQLRTTLRRETLAGNSVPRVALPRFDGDGELLRFLRSENLPGHFPFTAGVFPFKREGEEPARMFAGEGDAFRTNRRFHLLAPSTSVSMTINGPAPTILAFFLNAVLDQAAERGIDVATALRTVRGTVQADILKEDQGQNTCIFSTEFSLRMMADIQEW